MPTLYDAYQLSNSTQTPQYVGSTLPELMKVSDVMQQRYDASELGMENQASMIRNAKVSDKDASLWAQREAEYQKQLEDWSKRPDLENITRDVAKGSRRFAEEYKNFSDNMSRRIAFREELDKAVNEKKLSRNTADLIMSKAMYEDKGLQYDQTTGKYSNQFQPSSYANEVDVTEKIKKAVGDIAADERGTVTETPEGYYLVKNGHKVRQITDQEVSTRLWAAYRNDPEWQSDVNQRVKLGAWNSTVSASAKDVTPDIVEAAKTSGKSVSQVLYEKNANLLHDKILKDMGLLAGKYAFKEVNDERTLSADAVALKKLEDKVQPLISTIYQPFKPIDSGTPRDLDDAIKSKNEARTGVLQKMADWIREEGVVNRGGRMYDKNGNDVTFTWQKHRDLANQAHAAEQSLIDLKNQAKAKAGFSITPELEAKAKAAYEDAYKAIPADSRGLDQASIKVLKEGNAQKAYDAVIQNSPGYQRYKTVLADLSKGQAMQVGLTTFGSKATNEAAENGFKNLALNLDTDGLQFGALGLQWGTGDDANKPLSAGDYAKIKEDAKFVGVGIDVDGKYKFWYKVGNVQGVPQKNGEKGSVMVKMPAMAGTAEALIKNKQITEAEQVLTQSISEIINKPSGEGWLTFPRGRVHVKRVGDALNPNVAESQIVLDYQGDNGKTLQVPANTRAEAVSSLIQTLSSH